MLTYCRRRRSIDRECVCVVKEADRQVNGAVMPAALASCKVE
jgi:hypothetical protein